MNKLYIIFLLLIFSNCKNEVSQYLKNTTPLFDLKGFLDHEIATHLKDIKMVKKTVTVNGKTETKEVEIKDWKEELKPFFNSDINRPAWRDKYKFEKRMGDTIGFFHLFYRVDENLRTKTMSVYFLDENRAASVHVWNEQKSAIADSDEDLQYFGKANQQIYQIKTKQKMPLSDEQVIEIKVEKLKD